eukprot:gene10921-7578_t
MNGVFMARRNEPINNIFKNQKEEEGNMNGAKILPLLSAFATHARERSGNISSSNRRDKDISSLLDKKSIERVMLSADFIFRSEVYQKEAGPPRHCRIDGIELCAATPLLEEDGAALFKGLVLAAAQQENQFPPSPPPHLSSSSSSSPPPPLLRWADLPRSLERRDLSVVSFAPAPAPDAGAGAGANDAARAGPPVGLFLTRLHGDHPHRLSPELEALAIWTASTALRATLGDVVHAIAQHLRTAHPSQPQKEIRVERRDVVSALQELLAPCRGFQQGDHSQSAKEEEGRPAVTVIVSLLHFTANVILIDCEWAADVAPLLFPPAPQPEKDHLRRELRLLRRVRWSTSLVRALALLRHVASPTASSGSNSRRRTCQVLAVAPPAPVPGLPLPFSPSLAGKTAEQRPTALEGEQCFSMTLVALAPLRHSQYDAHLVSEMAETLHASFLQPAERARDDGTDAFAAAMQQLQSPGGGEEEGKGEQKGLGGVRPQLAAAAAAYLQCAALAQAGLQWPLTTAPLSQPRVCPAERRAATSALASWDLLQPQEGAEGGAGRGGAPPSAAALAAALRRRAVDEAVAALWASGLLPPPAPADEDEGEGRPSRAAVERRVDNWQRGVLAPFRLPGATQSHRWSALLETSLLGCHVGLGAAAASRAAGGMAAQHDLIAQHCAVRPAVAAMAWRGPPPAHTRLNKNNAEEGEAPPGTALWWSLLPCPTVLQLVTYALQRLCVVGYANAAQALLMTLRQPAKETQQRGQEEEEAEQKRMHKDAAAVAQACEESVTLVRDGLLAAHRPPVEQLHRLLSTAADGAPLSPFRLRLALHSHPLPPTCEDPLEENKSESDAETLWALQMQVKLLIRAKQLRTFAGQAAEATAAQQRLRQLHDRWVALRKAYAAGESAWGAEGRKKAGAGAASSDVVLADWLVVRLAAPAWEKLQADVRPAEDTVDSAVDAKRDVQGKVDACIIMHGYDMEKLKVRMTDEEIERLMEMENSLPRPDWYVSSEDEDDSQPPSEDDEEVRGLVAIRTLFRWIQGKIMIKAFIDTLIIIIIIITIALCSLLGNMRFLSVLQRYALQWPKYMLKGS